MLARLVALLLILTSPVAAADPAHEVRQLYTRFAAAQNALDLPAVRALLLDAPTFLWVSDGQSFWGPDAVLARMASFQGAQVWRVEPDLAHAVAVPVSADVAYLHLPLVLAIGDAERPDRLRFLVSMLGVATDAGWRIAALFTTTAKSPAASP
jgi:ketosteroid isomerase-like protein